MDRKDMDLASDAWGKFFSTEEGKRFKEKMITRLTSEKLKDLREAREELQKYGVTEKVDTLHLVLKRKWWDMIASGDKKEEYREIRHYWSIRLLNGSYRWFSQNTDYPIDYKGWLVDRLEHKHILFRDFENVCFHLGYTNVTITFKILSISINVGKSEWGAEPNKEYFVIKLGERIE